MRRRDPWALRAAGAFVTVALAGCAHRPEPTPGFHPPLGDTHASPAADRRPLSVTDAPDDTKQVGIATWYGADFAGRPTANGEKFDPHAMTAAHRKLPFGTWVEVRRVDTGRTVRVRINDRGPWGDDKRIIDLSRHAAELLDMIGAGKTRVELHVVDGP